MWKILCLVGCVCVFCGANKIDGKIIIAVRNGLKNNLRYINENYEKMNVDCILGVAIAAAVMEDAYQSGAHIMDSSSLKLIISADEILNKSRPFLNQRTTQKWIIKDVLDKKIWLKHIKYKKNSLRTPSKTLSTNALKNIYSSQDLEFLLHPSTDYCLHDVVNATKDLKPVKCLLKKQCWDHYFRDRFASGYILTHKMILLQVAKARSCLIDEKLYEIKVTKLCSQIFYELLNEDYYGKLEELFDLFLEQVVVCGYEGFADFFKNRWLILILKSQRDSGCFPLILNDNLKTRLKRNLNILEDGCADHTTGLGSAVLALYYNYIVKGNTALNYE